MEHKRRRLPVGVEQALDEVRAASRQSIDLTAKLDAIMRYQGLTVRQTAAGVYEVIKDIPQTGDYLDPIPWRPGDSVKVGLWYYTDDKALPHEAIADGYPATFQDAAFFDFVE